jgi:2'-5' RNA ligase
MPGNKKVTKLDRCVASVMKDGKSEDSAYAICQASISGKTGKTKKSIEHHGTTFPGYNKPTKSNRAGKKKMVLAKKGDKVKVVHYGDTNYKHNYSKEAKSSFRARHKCSEKNDKFSAAYWACRDLWPTGPTKKSALTYKAARMKNDPCWEGYEMVGHKMKGGKKVPNCVPKKGTKKSLEADLMRMQNMPPGIGISHNDNRDVMVAISVPKHVSGKIFLHDGEPECDMHVALAHVSPDCDISTLRLIVSEFAKGIMEPLELSTTGVGRFVNNPNHDVLYVSVDSPTLGLERERLIAMLEGNGIVVDKSHGFNPHITVKYMDKSEPAPEFSEVGVCNWVVNQIEIWQGSFRYKYGTIFHPTSQGVFL